MNTITTEEALKERIEVIEAAGCLHVIDHKRNKTVNMFLETKNVEAANFRLGYISALMNENSEGNGESSPLELLVMPRWMKQPHLFANGNFKLKYEDETGSYTERFDFEAAVDKKKWLKSKNTYGKISLVARQITDIRDYEIKEALQTLGGKTKANREIIAAYIGHGQPIKYHVSLFLFLLSIGIYPFDQTDFDGEYLIDAQAV